MMETIHEADISGDSSPYIEDNDEAITAELQFSPDTLERINTRPTSTPKMPTLLTRAMLVRTPKADIISEDSQADPRFLSYIDQPKSVLITELNEDFSLNAHEHFDNSESDDELYDETEIKPRKTALHPEIRETVTESRLDEYWDTDLEDDEVEEEDRVICQYKKVCNDLGVVPISYFIRHINDTDIKMRYHGLGPASARAIALILKDNVNVEKLNLSGNWIQPDGGKAVARMLEENDYLTDVSLGDNKLGNEGAQYICKMLDINAGLRSLDLSGNDFDDNSTKYLASAIENCKHLKKLNLSRNQFGETGGEALGPAIGANDRLDSIDLSWNHVRKRGACALAKGLKENIGLKECFLAWNGFGPEGGAAVAESLATNQSLTELDLSGNRLDYSTAERMAKTFKTNDTLRTLRMGNNLITTAGAIVLATAINANENCELEMLDLTDVPVEYEFLRIVEDIKLKKPDFQVIHGPIIRSGNTSGDLNKRAIDPYKTKEPVTILNQHIVVNDLRLVEILSRYDPTGTFSLLPEDFLKALDELAVPFDKPRLQEALQRISTDHSGRIYLGDTLQNKDNEDQTGVIIPQDSS